MTKYYIKIKARNGNYKEYWSIDPEELWKEVQIEKFGTTYKIIDWGKIE